MFVSPCVDKVEKPTIFKVRHTVLRINYSIDSSTSGLDLLFTMSGVVEWAEIHSDIAPDNGLLQGRVSGKPTGFDHRRLKNVWKFWAAVI